MQIGAEDLNKRISPREFMLSRLNLKKLTKDQPLTIHGLDAHTGLAPINTSFGSRTARFTVIYFDNRAYIMAGVTKDPGSAPEYDQDFLSSAQSFHAMSGNERLLARPLRLTTIQAGTDTRFSELAGNSPLETFPEEQLRLINAMYPQGEPQPGMLLKVVK